MYDYMFSALCRLNITHTSSAWFKPSKKSGVDQRFCKFKIWDIL